MTEPPAKLSYLPFGSAQPPSTDGEVVYYRDESAPPNRAWRWKYVATDGIVVAVSEESFLTRRGAMDDWNRIDLVLKRLRSKGE